MMGGPLGAVKHLELLDGGLEAIAFDDSLGVGATERVQSAFFTTTFAVMGYIASRTAR